ncbi:hypothetical protein NQ314_009987 [Rhamnusium bicolor]|uniref:Fcf2 pre-rRNA processing C-terminal domain-containing protein n=1 Tax=Rhamnusium bicolor TaxID=1586634 RepID=A0AAV8XWC1_9CUCU|nr:hypothetical protein NQ314_009987 [Rhamnusium bicolor]
MNFVIDTVGETSKEDAQREKTEDQNSFISELLKDYKESLVKTETEPIKNKNESSLVKEILNDLGWSNKLNPKKSLRYKAKEFTREVSNRNEVEDVLKKSVLTPEFEKLHAKEKEKTKGKKWYGLPATEMTEEVKHDLEILQMRSVLDPKHFYKKNDLKVLPKYFQIGKVMDSPLDYYNHRLTKKNAKRH